MKDVSLILCHATIVTMNTDGTILFDGAVAVNNDIIVAVGPSADICAHYQAQQIIDCHGCAIIPGLINAHACR
jgi:5-methylthioadenosine/S-adenosylhomocysteine deaminase